MTDLCCNVRVVCRVKPAFPLEGESLMSLANPLLNCVNENTIEIAKTQGCVMSEPFTFDRVFDGMSHQGEVYEFAARETIDDVLQGYNGTIFAYGQTGSGKSYTMFGPDIDESDLKGIIPRACSHIFKHIKNDREGTKFTIKCSFIEIYKETIRDLLNPRATKLKIRENPITGVWIEGVTEELVEEEQQVIDLIKEGEKIRAVSATRMNDQSSRSHSLFIVTVHQQLIDGSTRTGKLNLADLAGSEKVEKTGATGNTLEEAKKINQSLSALGNCIAALTQSRGHIPYRDSKLTFILRESLGGNTKTTLICTCSPHPSNADETLSTLRFGQRAKTIKNNVKVNRQRSAEELGKIASTLKRELRRIKRYATSLEGELVKVHGTGWSSPVPRPQAMSESRRHRSSTASRPSTARVSLMLSPSTPRASLANSRKSSLVDDIIDLSIDGYPVKERDSDNKSHEEAKVQDELERLRESSNNRIEELQEELEMLRSEKKKQEETLKHDISYMSRVNNEHEDKIRQAKEEKAQLQQLLREANETVAAIAEEKEKIRLTLDSLPNDRDDLLEQMEDLRGLIAVYQEKESSLIKHSRSIEEELDFVYSELENTKRMATPVDSNEWIASSQALIAQLQQQIHRLENSGKEADKKLATLEEEARRGQEKLAIIEKRLNQLETSVLLAQQEQIESLTARLHDVSKQWHKEIRTNEEGSKKMAEYRKQIDELEREVNEERFVNQHLQEEIQDAKATFEDKELYLQQQLNRYQELKSPVKKTTTVQQRGKGKMMPIKEGWLSMEVQGGNTTKKWKRRWGVLKADGLYYFSDKSNGIPKGVILLNDCYMASADKHTNKPNSFAIYHKARKTWYLEAEDSNSKDSWLSAIQNVLDTSCGVEKENRKAVTNY